MNTRLQKIERLCKKYQIKALYAFGSRAAETLHVLEDEAFQFRESQSDLDVGVLTHSPFSIDDKVNLALELEDTFNLPHVDLLVLNEVDAFLAANIIRGERIYAEDSYLADEYELFVLRRAGDLIDFERERMATILREV